MAEEAQEPSKKISSPCERIVAYMAKSIDLRDFISKYFLFKAPRPQSTNYFSLNINIPVVL